MQIVIVISDNDYEYLKNTSFVEDEKRIFEQTEEDRKSTITLFRLINSVKNSVQLPKNHGRLIDADALELDSDWNNYYDGYSAYSESMIKYAPTIIEADKEEEEMKRIRPQVVEQEPKTGHWINLKDTYGDIVESVCSNCDHNGNYKWKFCPNCGAKMESEE